MFLNAVSIFGNLSDGNGITLYVLLIVAFVLLLVGIIALVAVLIIGLSRMRQENEDESEDALTEQEQAEELEKIKELREVEGFDEFSAAGLEEESVEAGKLFYNRSFTAKFIQSDDETKNYYVHLKNEILSYKKVHARMSWKRETFRLGRNVVARIAYRGKTLCLYLPIDPATLTDSKYIVEDVSDIALYEDTPCLYRIRVERREKYAEELIAMVMEAMGTVRTDRIFEDYYMPYEGVVQLIDKGLIKRVVKDADFMNKQ